MALSVVILAAGQGTRMKSDTPKVLHTLSGKPMLFHAIDAAQAVSDDITIVLYHQAERIQQALEATYDKLRFHIQDAEHFPGTGGAMRGISPRHERTLILNGDMPLVTEASLRLLAEGDADINMSVLQLDPPPAYGRVIIANGRVQKIVEEKDCTPEEKAVTTLNAGVYCVSRYVLERYIPALGNANAQQEYYLTDIVEMAVDEGREVKPIPVEAEQFLGVNSKRDLANAEMIMQRRIRDRWMDEGVIMHLPETIYIESDVTFEGECEIENGVTIRGRSHIVRSHLKAHTVVESSAVIDSDVGPMGRIRPGTSLSATHIGNFVEVKNSTLDGVKAGHLSYIGDATIDEGSNIGAGVITCNYDGKAKHRTSIGKNVFIGSDSQLIAPVMILDETIIAAGTTVTKDVPYGALAISRTPMKLITGFFHKFFGKEAP
jgi:bifunctional UDP-N-acetylglucosamine pyrophosphorylase/glucosamine-1-phosphate N-acetyltransferase